ncbi:hypothetical protein HDV62DRAFT_376053 [Trichoderma sp. SZMC 28011]
MVQYSSICIVPMIGNLPAFSMRGSFNTLYAVVNTFHFTPGKKDSIMSFSLDHASLILAAKLTRRQPSPRIM